MSPCVPTRKTMAHLTDTVPNTAQVAALPGPALDHVSIWTDGGCRPNPGIGGWVAIMQAANGNEKVLSGGEPTTTNNRMEMMAAIRGLEALSRSFAVTLHTDSEYVFLGMKERVDGWRRSGWRTAKGRPVENRDLWERLTTAAARHHVEWGWTRGHAADAMNQRVDRLARAARERQARL